MIVTDKTDDKKTDNEQANRTIEKCVDIVKK